MTTRTRFDGRLLMLGCGSVGRCTLPLILRHVDMPASKITVMDFEDVRATIEEPLRAVVSSRRTSVAPNAGGAASSAVRARATFPAWRSTHFGSCRSGGRQRPS